ncbi:MAG: protein translocase subunit SecF [Ignavibacteriae bacterium]|nr:protein translocase subunit SecF [Ignavibacteriota bacterium]NOG96988.1 protein translocase subunit SecF [Ignavibacteriota bacterium]
MQIIDNLNIDFIKNRKIAYIVSSVLLILGIGSLVLRGLELGIDFKGGSEITLEFENPIDITDIREDLSNIGIGNVEVKTFGGEQGVLVRTELQNIPPEIFPRIVASITNFIDASFEGIQYSVTDSSRDHVTLRLPDPETAKNVSAKLLRHGFQSSLASQEANNVDLVVRVTISDWIQETLREKHADNKFSVSSETLVGPKIGDELKFDAIISILLALLVILIYIGFRFKFAFAVGAVAALFHDVIITLGIFSLLYDVIPGLNLEISVSIVAAFLTLIGYSINDSVVVFDRVRENLKIHKTAALEQNINRGINLTIRRTLVTSLTTLFVVTILLFFGGEVLRGFAFTMFFGIIIGTYSSIFVASNFVYEYAMKSKKKIQF